MEQINDNLWALDSEKLTDASKVAIMWAYFMGNVGVHYIKVDTQSNGAEVRVGNGDKLILHRSLIQEK